jgi:hypothetical protein
MRFGPREYLMTTLFIRCAGLAALALVFPTKSALPHGFAGDRFFPATILTDDPFVADEASLPTITRNPTAADGTQEIDIGVDLAKRILPDLGITIGREWKYVQSPGVRAVTGFGAFETSLQYQMFIDVPHEVMALAGISATWGHTGRVQALGEPDFPTLTPTFNWGKGFGDLPDWLPYLRPLASRAISVSIFRPRSTATATLIPTTSTMASPSSTVSSTSSTTSWTSASAVRSII